MRPICYTIFFALLSLPAASQLIIPALGSNQSGLDLLYNGLVVYGRNSGSGSTSASWIEDITLQKIPVPTKIPTIETDALAYNASIAAVKSYVKEILNHKKSDKVSLHNRDNRLLGEKILEAGRIRAKIEQTLELLVAPEKALQASFKDLERGHLGYVQKVTKDTKQKVNSLERIARRIEGDVNHIKQDVNDIRYSTETICMNTHYTNHLLHKINDELTRQETWRWNFSAFAGRGDYRGGSFAFRLDKSNMKNLTISIMGGLIEKNDGVVGGINAGGFFMKNFHLEAGPVLRSSDNALMGNARLSVLLPTGGNALLTPYICYLTAYGFGAGIGMAF